MTVPYKGAISKGKGSSSKHYLLGDMYVCMLCYVMLCYVMLCYVMLCYVMLCYVMYVCMYVCMYIIFRHVRIHDLSPFQKKLLSRDYSLRTQSPTERKPLSWTFCSTLKNICMHPGKLTWNLHFTHLAKENHLRNLHLCIRISSHLGKCMRIHGQQKPSWWLNQPL